MNDDRIRALLGSNDSAPLFERALAPAARAIWRVKPLPVAIAAAGVALALVVGTPLVLGGAPGPDPGLYSFDEPRSTDWLLDPPDRTWRQPHSTENN